MSISIVSVEKAIKTRACAYYAAARLIIEYSEAAKSYKVVALVRLNDIIKEFIGVKDVNTEKLKELIAKILGVLQYFHTSALESNISIAEAINHLAHAEHIYNWLFRDKDNIDYVGGNYLTTMNFEATLPNLLPESTKTEIGTFLDFGNVWGVDYDSSVDESNKIRSSAGATASWLSPLGPMTFVFSRNIAKADTDKTESFKFQLGTTF